MANAMFAAGKKSILDADIDLLVDAIRFDLVDEGVAVPDPATHDFRDDYVTGVGSTTADLGSKTTTAGVFDAADTLFPSVPNGTSYESIVLFKNTGVDSTSNAITYLDTQTGLPITGNGNDVDYLLDSGANKIFNWSG